MWYVYILENQVAHFYVGVTKDVLARLQQHNEGSVSSTKSRRPWKIRTYVGFDNELRARHFESYLKSGSGRAFQKRHF
ncbi:GIY-YIG nuclease family protein [Tichowtungia aerotolerans]|uniref:GIY-YIG nuclease family protein n=1 Tax=Tichowtungia aerotolerans TaxID=2697043 RepID=A0A6P1MBF4_9BACT|nr:GIY-YIG nuclease family protein [Tichowtungia aerotolerans]